VTTTQQKSIKNVLEKLGASYESAGEGITISGIAYDSREVRAGNAFFCIPGEKVDGNAFAADAIAHGAACIITENKHQDPKIPQVIVKDVRLALAMIAADFYGHPSQQVRLIGVTGTNGKTTTTHLVERMMLDCGRKTGLIGTLGARWEAGDDYSESKHTTPQSSDLQRILSAMRDASCSHVAMEVSSHALSQKRVAGCNFAVAALTNITQDHLDFHKTMENYWRSKRLLFESLNDSTQNNKTAVINMDDPLAKEFLSVCGGSIRKLTYGWEDADIHVKDARFESGGSRLQLATPNGVIELKTKLTGRFNVYNTMAALAICLAENADIESLRNSLEKFPGVSGRFEVVSSEKQPEPLCIVDYAHTPDGLDNVLKAAANVVPHGGKLIVVFGCGGDRDASKRPQMGEIAESRAQEVVVTSDNPRSEDPQQIIANILAGIKRMKNVKVEPDRATAIRLAVNGASDNDVVVVAGKGHENYQILADKVIPFDDRSEVLSALRERAAVRKGS
jgi:UDP-N-acetylmuramoyl-L-alanyl-D-glutamate--2,6-diaminopimelate ligase